MAQKAKTKRKVKTNRSAAKRYKIRGSGKVKRKRGHLRHGMRKKTSNTKRLLRKKTTVSKVDEVLVKQMLPNG